MNYYEELGLNPSASPSEIRAAYKRLVRLLHPDQHSEEELRRLAECQLKRLNEVYETLMDPARRRLYDLRCASPQGPLHSLRRHLRPAHPALALALAISSILAWRLPQRQTQSVKPAASQVTEQEPLAAPKDLEASPATVVRLLRSEIAESRREIQRLRDQRDSVMRELELLRSLAAKPVVSAPAGGPPQAPEVSLPPAPRPPLVTLPELAAPPATLPAPAAQGMAGLWVYVPARLNSGRPAGYTAEFVEVLILLEDGILRGRYRGRYRIPDRPISPEVSFHFQGPAGSEEAIVSWEGPGGAQGEMTLKLVAPDRLQIDWFATRLGTQLGLASGSSLLTRRRTP